MFGRSAPEPVTAPANAETRFSLVELRKLHKQLVENKKVTESNQNMVVEILRVIAEMVVYGDNKSELLFDFFCEKNMLSLFLEIMSNKAGCPSAVHIQILQTLSILISCVRNETSLYYLLSNNYVNEIIIFPHDFVNDESLCAQFASFMKTLSLKLNIHTVQFFFIEESGAFPILTRAVELLTIPDPMIRIASQSTILNVYRVEDSRARAYALQDEVMGIMFAQTVNFMENQYHSIFKSCKQYYKACNALDQPTAVKLEGKIDDTLSGMEDWFFYLQDLLDLDVPVLRKALVHQLIHDFLLPVLLNPLMKHHHLYQETVSKHYNSSNQLTSSASEEGLSDKHVRLPIVLGDAELELFDTIELIASLSYLLQMLKIVTHQALQRAVLVTLFHPLSLDCRTEILKEIAATKGISAVNSTTDLGISTSPAPECETTGSGHNGATTTAATGVALSGNLIKEAWDRLHQADNHKITLIMMYIEHILFDRIVPTAIDSTPGNEVMVQHEVDEEYLASHCPAITPLRTLNDPTNDAITMLQSLYYLPDKSYCEEECSSAAVTRALNLHSAAVTPAPASNGAHQSDNSLSEMSTSDPTRNDLWSSDLALEDGEMSTVTANIIADCEAEAEDGIASRFKAIQEERVEKRTDELPAEKKDSALQDHEQKEYGTLDRSGGDAFTSPPIKQHRNRLGRNDMLMPTESTMGVGLNSADQLMLPALRKLSAVMANKLPFYPEIKITYSVLPVFSVLCNTQSYSISAVQVAAHVIYSLSLLIASARNLSMPSPPSSKANSFSQPKGGSFSGANSKGNSFSAGVPLPERSSRIFFPDGCDPSSLMNQSILEYFAVNVREAGRIAAMKLLVRLEGSLPEMVLNLVKEEIARLEGQKWKRCIERMYQDVLLFLPPTQFSSERMGIDFDLPISQTEIIRKEIQVFILLRALYKRLHVLTTSTATLPDSIDDLCGSINDKSFLCLEEKNLLAGNFAVGAPFDMRGKRFLDLKISPIVPIVPKSVPEGGQADIQSRTASPARTGTGAGGGSSSSSSSTSWSKRLFGSSSSSSASQNNSVVNSPASPVPGASNLSAAVKDLDPIAQLIATKKKILFVQDSKSLIVVSCDKHDSKNGFKILIATPLIYADAQMDQKDGSKFKLIIRSSRTVQHMYPIEPDMLQLLREGGMEGLLDYDAPAEGLTLKSDNSNAQPAVPGGSKFVAPRIEAAKFLKNKTKTKFYQLTLRVESEQACKLAVHHIESKRKEQTMNKLQQLQRMLEYWASSLDVNDRED